MDTRERNFVKKLEIGTSHFIDHAEKYQGIVSISHDDADGFASGAVIQNMAKRSGLTCKSITHNNITPWNELLTPLLAQYKNFCFIMTDLGSSIREVAPVLDKNLESDFFILDHHLFNSQDLDLWPETVHFINPTEFGLNGLKEIAGATVAYNFAVHVNNKNRDSAWIALLGISGDTLMHAQDLRSFNRWVLEDALEEEQIIISNGLAAYGGSHRSLKDGLAGSILPFVPKCKGDSEIAAKLVEEVNIDPKMPLIDIDEEQATRIAEHLECLDLVGDTIVFPKKNDVLRYGFEHAMILSIIGSKNPVEAYNLIGRRSASKEMKKQYDSYMGEVIGNLAHFVSLSKVETSDAIIADVSELPYGTWSSVASYSSINQLYSPTKILFLGGETDGAMKFSVRCMNEFLASHEGKGAKEVIEQITEKYGGAGGGHALAGGIRLSFEEFEKAKKDGFKGFNLQ